MRFFKVLCMTLILIVFFTGCRAAETLDDAENYLTPVAEIDIPDDVTVIGLGEATHGNVEFQELKKDVFEGLIKKENVRVFVLEGDFGGSKVINDYIVYGKGSAKEAVYALDYGIYKTKQMIDLVEWMHDYNESVEDGNQVYFYGNDMQRYDHSKEELLAYYDTVNNEAAEKYAEQLKDATNDLMRNLTEKQQKSLMETIAHMISDLQKNEDTYRQKSSRDSFTLALQYAEVIKQRTILLAEEKQYQQVRDQFLAENLQWIVDFEAERGNDKVFVTAHNGHIEKTSASFGYKSMGDNLDEIYGEQYFAIGTDFLSSTFQVSNSKGRKDYTIKNKNELVSAFQNVESNVFYVDFKKAGESEKLTNIISTKQKMPNVGDDFRVWYTFLKMFYTIEMIPNEAYDGVIVVKKVTPTNVLE